jgi:hypothetical protein
MDPITAYKDLTDLVVTVTGLSRPMLHLHAGMTIYVLTQLLLGTRRGSMTALATVLAIELGNEVMNRLYWGSWRWDDTLGDIAITLFWPATCVAVSQFRRWRWSRSTARMPRAAQSLWPAAARPASA